MADPVLREPNAAGTAPSDLPGALRRVAGRAAEWSGGAVLLFGRDADGAEPRLRAAAGVPSPEAARDAAATLANAVHTTLSQGVGAELPALEAFGARGLAGTLVLPASLNGRVLGALVVGLPEPAHAALLRTLEALAEEVALRIDHARLAGERTGARKAPVAADHGKGGDELLRLSEQLFAQDIELMRHKEKLGQVERLKNDFIEKMSRELRTPLNSIIESIIGVLASENEALSPSSQQSLRGALDDGTAFLRTLQNILDLWRIKQKELPVEIQEVSFPDVVGEAIFSIQDTLDGKPVTVERRLEALPKIRTDLAKINQILFLLLDNAVKFTPQGRIEIVASVEDDALVCEVRDTGIGICPDDQQFLFDEFYQVDDLASTRYRGSGLGLALVRDLLELLDGEISFTSEPGVGSNFRFRVPVQVVD